MKKLIIGILIVLLLLLSAVLILPVVFKEDIKAAIHAQISENVRAKVYFDQEQFSLSLLRAFPYLQVRMGEFGIIGKDAFAGDTLLHVKTFALDLNLPSIISGNAIVLEGISLDRPKLYIKVTKEGKANYDIFGSETTETSEASTLAAPSDEQLLIQLKSWNMTNARIIYDDEQLATYLALNGLNQSGSGDLTLDNYDLVTTSTAQAITFIFEETAYLKDNTLAADIKINIDMPSWTFTFRENDIKINDFSLEGEGYFKMPEQGYEMDIAFHAKENDFKNILSLVPDEFLTDYESIKTAGNITFEGWVKGIYDDTKNVFPGYKINLQIKNGMFQYPELPDAVNGVQINMTIDGSEGIIDNTVIDIRQFAMQLGTHPIEGKLRVAGLTNYQVDADIKMKIDLSTLPQMLRMDSLALKGVFELDAKASGVYSESKKTIPQINTRMVLKKGYIKHEAYPLPIENIHLSSSIKNTNGKFNDTEIKIETFGMQLAKDRIESNGQVYDLDNAKYQFNITGGFDLANIDKVYPLENMTLSGKISMDIHTKGNMLAIEKEKYDQLPTSGIFGIKQFKLRLDSLPDYSIEEATLAFSPKNITLKEYRGKIGKSDMQMDGQIANYLAYALKDNQTLYGNLNFYSKYFDVNEWMPEEDTTVADTTIQQRTAKSEEIFIIPKNIDFSFNAQMDKIDMMDMEITKLKGVIHTKNGTMTLKNTNFMLLNGAFKTNGSYRTANPEKPAFDFSMDIKKLSFQKTYETFNSVKKLAPIAKGMSGTFDGDIAIKGNIGAGYEPVYETLFGKGKIHIARAGLKNNKVFDQIGNTTKLSVLKNPTFNDVDIIFDVKEGKMYVAPFDVVIDNIKTNISGSNSFTGEIDYLLRTSVPATTLGGSLAAQYSSFTGQTNIPLNLYVGGTAKKPKVKLTKGKSATQKESVAKKVVKEKAKEAKEEVKKSGKKLIDDLLNNKDTTKSDKEKINDAVEDAKDALKGLFGGKKKKKN